MSLRIERTLHLDGLKADVAATLPEAVQMAMEHVKEVSVELTPIEEGTLRRSAKAGVEVNGEEVVGYVHYDGPYARYQHEKMELRHKVGQAKFLETAMFTQSDEALKIIAAQLRETL